MLCKGFRWWDGEESFGPDFPASCMNCSCTQDRHFKIVIGAAVNLGHMYLQGDGVHSEARAQVPAGRPAQMLIHGSCTRQCIWYLESYQWALEEHSLNEWCSSIFFVSISKDSLQVFRQVNLFFPWHWESLPGTAESPLWSSSDIVARRASPRASLSMNYVETYFLPRCVYANSWTCVPVFELFHAFVVFPLDSSIYQF